jgi:hypothetical protein
MKTKRSPASTFLVLQGILFMCLGLYFVFIRPPLLPEDPRFIEASINDIRSTLPGLLIWLRRVFWVMGGFMFTTGLLTTYIATILFPYITRGARTVITLASLTSIGWMTIVNFMINSDFKWLLLAFNLPWILALVACREGHALPSNQQST